MKASLPLVLVSMMLAASCWPEFEVEEFQGLRRIVENGRAVLDLAFGGDRLNEADGIALRRLCDPYGDPYIGSGTVTSGAVALDWGVDRCRRGDRVLGPFRMGAAGRRFERIETLAIDESALAMKFLHAWLDENGEAFVLETATLVIHAERYSRRAVDLKVRLINVGDEALVLEASARGGFFGLAAYFDPQRPNLSFRDTSHDYRPAPIEYRGDWLATLSRSPTRIKQVGFALFQKPEPVAAQFGILTASAEGVLGFDPSSRTDTRLEPGESTEWNVRLYCFVDDLPAKEIEAAYRRYLGGDTW